MANRDFAVLSDEENKPEQEEDQSVVTRGFWRPGLLIVPLRVIVGVVHWLFFFIFQQKAFKHFHSNHMAALLAYLNNKIDLNSIF